VSITKIKSYGRDRYRVRYREPGSRSPLSRTFDAKEEAQAFEADLFLARRSGGVQVRKASTTSLEAFGQEYLTKYANVELAKSTLAVYKAMWNGHVLKNLGAHPLATLSSNPELVQGFKADLIAEGVGEQAVRKSLAVLSAVLSKAVEWNRIPNNPVATVRLPSPKRAREIVALSPESIEAIKATMPAEADRRLVSLMGYEGLRPGEALALRGSDVGERTIRIARALQLGEVGETKTRIDRTVPLLTPVADDLQGVGTGLIFPRSDGEPWADHNWRNWRVRVWQEACAKVGLGTITTTEVAAAKGKTRAKIKRTYEGPRPYDLRHSFASLLLAEQRNPLEVARIMGHSPQVLFSTYAHVIAELEGQPAVSAEDRIKAARAT
jgi:integrase